MRRWERSKTKSLKYGKSIDGFLEKINDGQEVDFDHIWNVKRFIYYHHQSEDFHRVMIFIDGVDYIFVQYYFEDEEHLVNITKQHSNSKSNAKSYRRTKESVKNAIRKSSVGPKDTITNIYQQAGGYSAVRSCSDLPRNRKQISNMRYAEKIQTLKDDIIEVIDMCKMEKKSSNFTRNICVAPEKVISLMTNRQLNDNKKLCTSNVEASILGIDPTYNIGPCFVTISTYRQLQFLTKDNVHPVMLGPLIVHTSKDYQSYFSLPSEILRLVPALKDLKVFGSDSETNVYQPFVDLFPPATHLLCDLHMKNNIQSRLSDLKFNITEKDEVMCDVFGKRLGDYVKKDLVDSEPVEKFDNIVVEIKNKWMKFEGRGEMLFKYMESGKLKMIKECMRSDLRSVSGLEFPPKPYTQNANESANNMIKRNLKKLNRISDVEKEMRKRIQEQDIQIELSLIGQGEWKVSPGYKEFKITEDKFYQMTTEKRLKFKERFNTVEIRRPILNSLSPENHATLSATSIKPEDSGIMFPPLPILH